MFSILADDRLHEVERRLAVGSGEGPGERHAGHAVFLDRVDLEQVFGDVIEGSDDDHRVGLEAGHGSERRRADQQNPGQQKLNLGAVG
jgi:hypothetical protein